MKRKIVSGVLFIICTLLIAGCAEKETKETREEKTQQPAWLEEVYNSDYEYRISSITGEEGSEQETFMYEGKVINSPYKHYQKVIYPGGSQVWTELYSYDTEGEITNLVKTVQGDWVKQRGERFYPDGYGKELKFVKSGTVEYNNTVCDVYTAEYVVDIAETVNENAGEEVISEPLTAVVSQEYYVDPSEDRLLCIISDITDMSSKQLMAMYMANDGLSLEEAEEQYGDTEKKKTKMEILSYDDSLTIDIPSIETIN